MIQPFFSHGSVVIHAVHDIWVHVRCQRRKLNTDGPCFLYTEGRFFMISCNISWYHDKNDSISRHTGSRYKVQQYHAVFMISCGTSVMISCKFSWYELWRHMTSHDVTMTSLSYHEKCRMISWKWHDAIFSWYEKMTSQKGNMTSFLVTFCDVDGVLLMFRRNPGGTIDAGW